MHIKILSRKLTLICLICLLFTIPVSSQTQTAAAASFELTSAQLGNIEAKLEQRRAELGIPGAALVIIKDDRIILLKGFGYKNLADKSAVTPDTEFAIGSATKAFTALSVLMSQDAGKLNLDDNPKKYLPYFKISDADINARITIRDLLSHSSGLNRTDLAMITGKLNREELIKVAGEAKPTAKLREKFQYQNIMFVTAGEIAARTNGTTWEKFVAERIFAPLGMTNSNLSSAAMQRSKDFSLGYDYNADTRETRVLPMRNINDIAPAGAINSSARDMANWLRLMLNNGVAPNGKRLVSENGFAEITKPQMKIGGGMSYGFGWFIQDYKGAKMIQHGGNIDGFNSMAALIPEKKIGFVLLTNVTASPLADEMRSVVFDYLLAAAPNAAAANNGTAEGETGKYRFAAAGFDIEVKITDGKLTAVIPGQPQYVMENVGGRKYRLSGAPDGFFVTFKDAEAFLEQPQGSYTLPKVKADNSVETKPASAAAKELIGQYANEKNPNAVIEIAEKEGKTALIVPGQPPYELSDKAKDVFSPAGLPDSFAVKAVRDAGGKISGIILNQPQGDAAFKRLDAAAVAANAPKITVDEFMPKVITALGGAENWRKLNSRIAKFTLDFVNQGVKGSGTQYAKAPNMITSEAKITALGREIGFLTEYFNGAEGGEIVSFAPPEKYSGKQLEDSRLSADFYGLLDWKTNYKTATMLTNSKVGDEDALVIAFEPEKGNKDTIYFSAKTFLPLKLESIVSSSTSGANSPFSERYEDYRLIDNVMIPFRTVSSSISNGDVVTVLTEVKHNVAVDDKIFQPKK